MTRRIAIVVTTDDNIVDFHQCLAYLACTKIDDQRLIDRDDAMVWVIADKGSESDSHIQCMDHHGFSIKYHSAPKHLGEEALLAYAANMYLAVLDYEWVILLRDTDVLSEHAIELMQAFISVYNEDNITALLVQKGTRSDIRAVPSWFWKRFGKEVNTEQSFDKGMTTAIEENGLLGAHFDENHSPGMQLTQEVERWD